MTQLTWQEKKSLNKPRLTVGGKYDSNWNFLITPGHTKYE